MALSIFVLQKPFVKETGSTTQEDLTPLPGVRHKNFYNSPPIPPHQSALASASATIPNHPSAGARQSVLAGEGSSFICERECTPDDFLWYGQFFLSSSGHNWRLAASGNSFSLGARASSLPGVVQASTLASIARKMQRTQRMNCLWLEANRYGNKTKKPLPRSAQHLALAWVCLV